MKSILLGMAFIMSVPTVSHAAEVTVVSSPSYGPVARGAVRVPVLDFHIEAPCTTPPITIQSVTINHKGLGASTDIARVYLLLGRTRISRSVPLPSQGEPLTLVLRAMGVPACTTKYLTLAVDFSPNADIAGEHVFSLASMDMSDAKVTYETAGESSLHVVGSENLANVNAELLPVLTSVSYGKSRTIARLSVQGSAGKDQRITAITLTNNGSASDTDIQNLYWATRTGEKISEIIPQLQGRTARITFDPGLLLQGRDTKLIELHADVRASRKRTIRWSIEEPSDIEAVEVRDR